MPNDSTATTGPWRILVLDRSPDDMKFIIAVVANGVSPVIRVEDVGVIAGEDALTLEGPAGWVPAGPWCACWRRGGQSDVTSATAARALASSTIALRVA